MKRIRFWVAFALALLALSALFALSASAEDMIEEGECGDGVRWELNLNKGELTVLGEGAMEDYGSITGISPPWFSYRNSIRSVTVQEGVTALGASAFFQCTNLTEVTLPQSITAIAANAFANCSKLNELNLPSTVTAIGDSAFIRCSSLTRIGLPEGLQSIGSYAFGSCTSLTELTLPTGVQTIGEQAFSGCTRLTAVSLPNTLTHVGSSVFANSPVSKVLFYGTQDEWNTVSVSSGNDVLTSALIIHPGHMYDREIPDYTYLKSGADCENAETYYKSCACGEMGSEVFTFGDPLGHTPITAATCQSLAVCFICNKSYGELGAHTPDGEPNCLTDVHCALCKGLLTAALGHEYEDTVVPPTCTLTGHTIHDCVRCDDHYTDTPTDPTGHTDGDPATCTEDQLCTVCGEVLVGMLGHDYESVVTLQPTCTEEGTRVDTCSRCPDSHTVTLPPKGHTPDGEVSCIAAQYCTECHIKLSDKLEHDYGSVTVEPTCTDRGYTRHDCSRCDASYLDSFVDPKAHTPGAIATCTAPQLCTVCSSVIAEATEHHYTTVTVPPTCLDQGYTRHTCSVCSYSYADSLIPALDHVAGNAATCTAPQICTRCNGVLAEALDHDYETHVVAPTCTERGYTVHDCTRCDSVYNDTFVTAKAHTPGEAATCTAPQLCTDCSAVLSSAREHTYKDTRVAATCLERGYTLHTCTRCDHSYTDSFTSALGHAPGAPATCTTPQTCAVCFTVLNEASGHTYRTSEEAATCLEAGYTLHTCSTCTHSYRVTNDPAKGHTPGAEATCETPQLCTDCATVLARAYGHDYRATDVAATCTDKGYTLHTCSRCAHSYTSDATPALGHREGAQATCTTPEVCLRCNTILTDRLGHTYIETVVAPTCTENGYTLHVCIRCTTGHTDTSVAPTGHTRSDWITDRIPAFGEPGRKHTECSVCGSILEKETFSEETAAPTEPVDGETASESDSTEEATTSLIDPAADKGCAQTLGNILVISIVMIAVFLFWLFESKRKRH